MNASPHADRDASEEPRQSGGPVRGHRVEWVVFDEAQRFDGDHPVPPGLARLVDRARGVRHTAPDFTPEARCGAEVPPGVGRNMVDCVLPAGHDGQHLSTTGCAGSEYRWADAPEASDGSDR